MKIILICAIALCLLAAGLFIFTDKDASQEFRTVRIGTAEVSVQVADTHSEITRGLSGREKMPESEGMLFVFKTPDRYSFWMKDMHFPIDIIWMDENKRIVEILSDIQPESYPQTFTPGTPVLYVLEVNAGWTVRNNVAPGLQLELK